MNRKVLDVVRASNGYRVLIAWYPEKLKDVCDYELTQGYGITEDEAYRDADWQYLMKHNIGSECGHDGKRLVQRTGASCGLAWERA